MFARGSRYQQTRPYVFEDPTVGFRGVRPRPIAAAPGVLEHTLRAWDRLDLLALHYYNDPKRWWRIVDANPDILFAGDLHEGDLAGTVILIPRAEP